MVPKKSFLFGVLSDCGRIIGYYVHVNRRERGLQVARVVEGELNTNAELEA